MASVQSAVEIITKSELSPTEHLILKHFVESAVDPETAAKYIISRTQTTRDGVEESLREFKGQWRLLATRLTVVDPIPREIPDLVLQRDGPDFTMGWRPGHIPGSVVERAHIIPPSMIHDLELVEEGSLFSMLNAFLSRDRVARLRTIITNESKDGATYLRNLLLLRTLYPEEVSGLYPGDGTPFLNTIQLFELSTSDAKNICLPSHFLLNVHLRFATALHLFHIENKANRGWPKPPYELSLSATTVRTLRSLWLCMPQWLRVSCSMPLNKIGRKLYPLEAGVWAQRLPFGLYMKQCSRAPRNEPHVLELIEERTTIPAPRLVNTWEQDGGVNVLMTRLPGVPIDCVAQMRKIENTTPYLICDALGDKPLTHSDLHPSNILMQNGRLSSIYWEFTKTMYGTMGPGLMADIWWRTFGREYEAEFQVEQQLW
ncbi:uncharacterized protein BJX67DRAFT_371892 [Aspergillus lucknowensis]|uniref:Aminoglycoside phosphotransferase domain-containing protein n=1 Tax=Aspergillus lucknowensis TaxID=176173 RepID=A0ABR4LSM7_9EURO